MNIKQHLEAGHYPKDEKGRPMVPVRGGGDATILATDRDTWDSAREPIIGILPNGATHSWWAAGEHSRRQPSDLDLLPPAPRKVEVKRWAIFDHLGGYVCTEGSRAQAVSHTCGDGRTAFRIVELTGSYEMPWGDE